MTKSVTATLCVAISLLVGLIVFAVAATTDHIRGYKFPNGPAITVHYKGWGIKVSSTSNSVVIDSSIAIGTKEILVDSKSIAIVPQGTKTIDAFLNGNYVDFVADGQTIATLLRK